MRVVIATPLYPPEIGGPATYAKLLEEGLPSRGVEVVVVTFSEVRHLSKIVRHYAYYRRVLKAARSADLVLALDPVSVGLPALYAAKKVQKPFVVKIVGDYAWEQGVQRFGVTQSLDEFVRTKKISFPVLVFRYIQKYVAQTAQKVIVPSDYLKDIVAEWGIATERIYRIYNAVEIPAALPVHTKKDGEFLIVSSGRRVPWKGFEAIEKIAQAFPKWRVFIASGLSRSEALGWVQAADVFVLNSTYEGFPHALIEAMMLGTPVVAAGNKGNKELVTQGETGLLVTPGDDNSLREALTTVLHDPTTARARAHAAQEQVKKFSLTRMLDATADLLKSL